MKLDTSILDKIGLQLWTVRHELEKNPECCLQKLYELGYRRFEGMHLQQVASLQEYTSNIGLEIKSSFFQWPYLTNNWALANKRGIHKINGIETIDALIDFANQLGINHLTLGYLLEEERSIDDFKKWADALNQMGEKCKEANITVSYHHHAFEFIEDNHTTPFQILIDRLENELVKFEIDVFWLKAAGVHPIQMLKNLEHRVSSIHLKDIHSFHEKRYDDQKMPQDQYVPLGKGIIDFPTILQEAERQKVSRYFIEQDYSQDTYESIKTSLMYIKSLL
ncbi:sugar phosphate isomerase/epimerase family protein [Flammeovirga sp. SubArs3]|uniref:sugar phosphate isomerase/epimerase family protein n=1 Tax=Flammeovirga sp. SubArs3 TaxID=2995316 RepID=UPI00248D1C6B|nr:sugar phosphate isomerase/epimerase family protein [Flammeovirga sp. SubArs3]